jgi:CheY-like chemotaxis protein
MSHPKRSTHYFQTPPHPFPAADETHVRLNPDYVGDETVLLVDDNPAFRELLALALRAYGYRVIDAANGEDALAQLSRYAAPVHLILTDVVMPELDGQRLVSRLRGWYPHLRVIFMSGYPERATQVTNDARTLFLLKPFSISHLLAGMRELLGTRSRVRTSAGRDEASTPRLP